MAAEHTNALAPGLSRAEQGKRMQMEEKRQAGPEPENGGGEHPRLVYVKSFRGLWKRTVPEEVAREQRKDLPRHWGSQLQEFMKALGPPSSGQESPRIPRPLPRSNVRGFRFPFEEMTESNRPPKEPQLLPGLGTEGPQAKESLAAQDKTDCPKAAWEVLIEEPINSHVMSPLEEDPAQKVLLDPWQRPHVGELTLEGGAEASLLAEVYRREPEVPTDSTYVVLTLLFV
ncbi:UNVERIFIED_CONTAM: hypothetical protein K2H54_062058 [Gekko kuhli]